MGSSGSDVEQNLTNMFDLNEAIRTWRKRVQATGYIEDGEAEELESHLRDAIESFRAQGLSEEAAFEKATRQLGTVTGLAKEHGFSHERKAWQVSRTFLPGLFINYLKIAVRGMRSNQSYNWINIAGLAIGLTACLFITYFTLFELSYDRQYADKHIYRIINEGRTAGGVLEKDAGGPVPLGPTLLEEYPDIKQSVRLWRAYLPAITYEDKIFQERKFLFADTNVLNVFPFELVKGEASTAFKLANSAILSEGMAKKYFGDMDPIGKTITYNGYPGNTRSFIITGVFRNLPVNTHFDFDFLASFQSIQDVEAGWGSFKPVWTYLELASAAAAADLEQKLPGFAEKYLSNRKKNRDLRFRLEPVASIYLHSDTQRPMKPSGNIALLRILGFTGILILLMSCANFIQIALARVLVRLREAGVRKVLGATRSQLLTQNLSELLLSLMISLLAATTLIYLLIPSFESVTQIPFAFSFMVSPEFIITMVTLLLLIVILTGYLPATFVWSLSVVESLRQRISPRNGKTIDARRALLGFQFMISGALIMSLLVVNDQLNFIRKLDVGATLDNIIAIPFSENPDVFENRVRALGVESMAYSQRLPVNTLNYDSAGSRPPRSPSGGELFHYFRIPGHLQA